MRIERITLLRVDVMPKKLEPGVLYYAEKYNAAAHLCACGCGEKVPTPIKPSRWQLSETSHGPTLHPSIGNWQITCRSHYWLRNGRIEWAGQWSEDQIVAGRQAEQRRRAAYHAERNRPLKRFWRWVCSLFS